MAPNMRNEIDMTAHLPSGHPSVAFGKIGVLLVNLGTPEATGFWPVRRYLKEFLWDKRVIEVSRPLWWLILNGVILNTRPRKSGHAYDKIWNRERNESPLKTITRSQAEKLAAKLGDAEAVIVDWAMRYGEPPIGPRLQAFKERGCERILVVPLYPQYAAATTATVMDKVFEHLMAMRWQPTLRGAPPYHDEPAYIDALAQSLEGHLATLGWQPDLILASFHGLPQAYLDKGDPYHCHCMNTARLLRERLRLPKEKLQVVFQSRFGKTQWLKPYAQDTVEGLPATGVKKLAMIMPGFAADCVETLEEVAIGLKQSFLNNGGEAFTAVPCLNDSAASMTMLDHLVRRELSGWL